MKSARETKGKHAAQRTVFIAGMCLLAAGVSALTAELQGGFLSAWSPLSAGVLVLAFSAARLLTIRFPQGDEACVVLMVGLTSLGVMDVGSVLLVSACSGLFDAVVRYSQDRTLGGVLRAEDALRGVAVLGLLSPWQLAIQPMLRDSSPGDEILVVVVVAGVSYALLDAFTLAIVQRLAGGGQPVGHGTLALLGSLASVYLVHIAMAAVVLRVYPSLGLWGFAIALLLTLILQNSVGLYMKIRRAYGDTIGALAHAAELDCAEGTGRSRRVADTSIAVARRMGMTGNSLSAVRYAALLHDIGRIGFASADQTSECANRGAEIVSSIPFLKDVAPLIGHQNDTDVPDSLVGAAVVGVCSRYDRLREHSGSDAALETILREEKGVRHDVALVLWRVAGSRREEPRK